MARGLDRAMKNAERVQFGGVNKNQGAGVHCRITANSFFSGSLSLGMLVT